MSEYNKYTRTFTVLELADILRRAEVAHAQYEKTLGEKDQDWPDFYAIFILLEKSE